MLQITLREIKPNILIITEHKMTATEIERLNLQNYKVTSFYERNTTIGGGVMILAENLLKIKSVNIPLVKKLVEDKLFECSVAEFKCDNLNCGLVAVYRTPSKLKINENTFIDRLNILLKVLYSKYDTIIVAGDVNIDVLEESSAKTKLINVLKSYNMCYTVDFPTRYSKHKNSAIDNIFTNLSKGQFNIHGLVTEISDHDAQILEIFNTGPKKIFNKNYFTKSSRNFSKSNMDLFNKCIANENWMNVYYSEPNKKFDVFFSTFIYYFDLCFPKRKQRQSLLKKNWVTTELIRDKQSLINMSIAARNVKYSDKIKENLDKKKREFKAKIIQSKLAYYDNLISKSNNVCKATWKVVNTEVSNKNRSLENCNVTISTNNGTMHDPYKISEMFNTYYCTMVDEQIVPKLSNTENASVSRVHVSPHSFSPKTITEYELDQTISSFGNKFSCGYDDIPMPVIKHASSFLLKPLTHVINSSVITGIFPNKLKIAKIKPILKSGDSKQIKNYRPISLLTSFSKIFERVMFNQLFDFLETHNLIVSEQHGFRKNRSVTTAATDYIESIIDSLDKGEVTVGIFMDMSKAFDSVSHNKLLQLLAGLGLNRRCLSWFQSYLTDREQFVELDYINRFSEKEVIWSPLKKIKYGVPQGSILGPLLFVIYLNGLPGVVRTADKLCLYADDISLKKANQDKNRLEVSAYTCLAEINQFLSNLNLLMNPEKTKYISFSTVQNKNINSINILVDDHLLEEVECSKFLGFHIDKSLTYNQHVRSLCKKISSGLYALRQMSRICNKETLRIVYFSLIHSHVAFGIILYGATSFKNMKEILLMQKEAIRIILKLNWQDSVKDYFSELGIMTVFCQYIYETVLYVKKISPDLITLGTHHQYNTRGRNDLAFPCHRLQLYARRPSYAGIKFINHLPSYIKKECKFSIFKKKLKEYLVTKPIYSFDEFFSEIG